MFIYKQKEKQYKIIEAEPGHTLETRVEAGIYNLKVEESMFSRELFLTNVTSLYEEGKIINTGIYKTIWDKVNTYFEPEMFEARKIMGLRNKMSLIFNGKPGTGKTFLAGQIALDLVKKIDAVGIIITDDIKIDAFVDKIRKHDPDRTIILILDEFEKVYDMQRISSDLLAFLDGSKSKENVVLLATANNTGRMPDVLTNRPGRFEEIYEFSVHDDDVLRAMIEAVIPKEYKEKLNVSKLMETVKQKKIYAVDRLVLFIRDEIYNVLKIAEEPEVVAEE